MAEPDDAALVRRVWNGDHDAYGQLMQRYQDKLVRYVTYLLSTDAYSDDVVQETFIRAYTNLRSFDTKRSFSAWLYRIAHNCAMNAVKKHRREFASETIDELSHSDNVEVSLDNELLAKHIRSALNGLEMKYREPLMLHLVEGYSYKDISDILNLPVNTVATRISRARAKAQVILMAKGVQP